MIRRYIKFDKIYIKGTPAPALYGRRKASKVKVKDAGGVPPAPALFAEGLPPSALLHARR